LLGTVSPIKAHRISQFNAAKNTNGVGTSGPENWGAAIRSMWNSNYSMKNYFQGQTYRYRPGRQSGIYGNIKSPGTQAIANRRMAVAGAAGAWGASSFLMGNDNPVSNFVSSTASLGVHAGITAAIGSKSPVAAMAYAGVAIANMARPGNNWGPM